MMKAGGGKKKNIYILYFAAALPSRQRCMSSVTLHNIKVCVFCAERACILCYYINTTGMFLLCFYLFLVSNEINRLVYCN